MLGRAPTSGAPGAAVVFMADRVRGNDGERDGDSIVILRPAPFAFVEDGWTLVAITTTNQTLSASLSRQNLPATVPVEHLRADIDIARLEIRDANDTPLYLGVGPATQTQNALRHTRGRHGGGGHGPVEPDGDAPPADHAVTAPTFRENDREIG
jgi:hypothetical protein